MSTSLAEQLQATYLELLLPMRTAKGFDGEKFEDFCGVLKKCKAEWQSLDAIPKGAVAILIEAYTSMNSLAMSYDAEEKNAIIQAAEEAYELILDCL